MFSSNINKQPGAFCVKCLQGLSLNCWKLGHRIVRKQTNPEPLPRHKRERLQNQSHEMSNTLPLHHKSPGVAFCHAPYSAILRYLYSSYPAPPPTHFQPPHPLSSMAFLFRALHFLYVSATAGALAGQICASLPRGSFSQKIPIRPGGHHWGKLSFANSTRKKG